LRQKQVPKLKVLQYLTTEPSGVGNRLEAMPFFGTTAIAQCTKQIFAGGKIKPFAVQH